MDIFENPPLDELVDELYHYGMPRRSGRYPWGSGDDPYQHSGDFLSRVNELKKKGYSESKIAETLGVGETDKNGVFKPSSTRLRAQISLAKEERRTLDVATAKGLREKGYSLNQIAEKMGFKNDSSVRSLLNENSEARMNQSRETAEFLKQKIKENPGKFIDVGVGVERELNVSKEKMNQALEILKMEGYEVYSGRMDQVTNPTQKTTVKVLCPPGTKHKEIYDTTKITSAKMEEYITRDDGKTFEKKFNYPASMDSNRLQIRYSEDGGTAKDGVIELRRGVQDLDLKGKHYAQVRILVDNNKYLKGMAVYGDDKDFPPGVDVIFNTNKSKSKSKMEVLKDVKRDKDGNIDPDNPFGSSIKEADKGGQYWYTDKNGKKQLGLINATRTEGDWSEWKDKVPSQFLSKQPLTLAKRQLSIAKQDKIDEFNDIMSLNNPTVKKRLLDTFANDCDSAALHLQAAAFPRQKYQVILPINSLKDNEVYAPNYKNGEQVALIRYPHGGTFEIPILTVNNRHPQARKLLGTDITDAVGINSKNAERLSGADFDGDTVMVIPTNNKVKIKSTRQLKDLEGFDPKIEYASVEKDGEYYNATTGKKFKVMSNTQNEMGRISNLITDMTLQGANEDELARAVKHSMVVIDAEKHKLDYRQSYIDNRIDSLKKEYQEGGASTLISRAKGQYTVDKRQGSPKVNIKGKDYGDPELNAQSKVRPEGALLYKTADDLYYPDRTYNKSTGEVTLRTTDGKKIHYQVSDRKAADKYEPIEVVDSKTGEIRYTNKDGSISYKVNKRRQESTNMAETDDAYTLVSKANTQMERVYADYANDMKGLANRARIEMVNAGKIEYSSAAKKTYQEEVSSLEYKLNEALKNAPRERQAQAMANSIVNAKKQSNPDMSKDEIKKASQQALTKAREQVGAKRTTIDVTDREWEAIQAGAISESKLNKILNNTDIDVIREKATPKSTVTLSAAKVSRINSMKALGYTNAEIANKMGISPSTVSKYAN